MHAASCRQVALQAGAGQGAAQAPAPRPVPGGRASPGASGLAFPDPCPSLPSGDLERAGKEATQDSPLGPAFWACPLDRAQALFSE